MLPDSKISQLISLQIPGLTYVMWQYRVTGPLYAACSAATGTYRTTAQRDNLIFKYTIMLTILLLVAGLACFVLFFRSIDYFENI
jgi:hypothetical protein